jgi:acyl-CoA reductase-like NAD-dependent aldehyde dehydrogenase
VACAEADPDGWRRLDHDARSTVLGRVAAELRRSRAELLRVALLDGGKLLTETDPAVSLAVDFV